MKHDLDLTRLARDRMTARGIPPGIVALLMDHGEPRQCQDGVQSCTLTRAGMAAIRNDHGRALARALAPYQQAYVVMIDGRVVTVAWKRKGRRANFSRNGRGR